MGCCESTHCDDHHHHCGEEGYDDYPRSRVGYQPLQKTQHNYIVGTQPPPFIPPPSQPALPNQYQYQSPYPQQQQQYYGPPPSLHQTGAVYEVTINHLLLLVIGLGSISSFYELFYFYDSFYFHTFCVTNNWFLFSNGCINTHHNMGIPLHVEERHIAMIHPLHVAEVLVIKVYLIVFVFCIYLLLLIYFSWPLVYFNLRVLCNYH